MIYYRFVPHGRRIGMHAILSQRWRIGLAIACLVAGMEQSTLAQDTAIPADPDHNAVISDHANAPLFSATEKSFWAFHPIADPAVPAAKFSTWSTSAIDHFILTVLERKGLNPCPPATRRPLLRRVTFDLIGLPPTSTEINAYLRDDSPAAWERTVDRLLASPHYGERWGRHWLDVVRYADTTANDGDFVMRYAYRYRNYVIDAFNDDLPYDQFVVEQLAGDLLPETTNIGLNTRRAIATGFLMLGPKALAEADKEQVRLDMADEQIDVVGRSMLGLTVACARCHDHKFDPIPTTDYYSLAGIFRGIEILNGASGVTAMWAERQLDQTTPELRRQIESLNQQVKQLETEADQRAKTAAQDQPAWEAAASENIAAADQPIDLPLSVMSDLVVWLDASDLENNASDMHPSTGTTIDVWKDKSGNGNHLSSIEESTNPAYVVAGIQGRPVIRFAGDGHQALRKAEPYGLPDGNSDRSMFVVSVPRNKKHNSESLDSISQVVSWGVHAKSRWNLFQYVRGKLYMAHANNDFHDGSQSYDRDVAAIFEQRHMSTDDDEKSRSTYWKNGFTDGSFVPEPPLTTDAKGSLFVGSSNSQTHDDGHRSFVDVAEVLIFRRSLNEAERNRVGGYLAQKYGIDVAYPSPLDIVAIPPRERSEQQRRLLRDYYVEQHDAAYRHIQNEIRHARGQLSELEQQRPTPIPVMMPIELGGRNLRVHTRGNRFTLGDEVPRRFLQVIAGEDHAPIKSKQSGRLQLARWIASPDNPLAARVMVNRIWQGHFGTGLVASSDNFGKLGTPPSHPQLLDWLASRFIESRWSIKAMHRRILCSSTYRQSTQSANTSHSALRTPKSIDPSNRLLWRFPKRRLEAEVLRDAMLAASGQLDRSIGGGGEVITELYENGAVENAKLGLVAASSLNFDNAIYQIRRRSVYLPLIRNQLAEILAIFDAANPTAVTSK